MLTTWLTTWLNWKLELVRTAREPVLPQLLHAAELVTAVEHWKAPLPVRALWPWGTSR